MEDALRFRGVHVMNKGSRVGSAEVADSIRRTGVLYANYGTYGHGVYGQFLENKPAYEREPHLIFDTEIEPDQLDTVETHAGRIKFFRIITEEDLHITVVGFANLDREIDGGDE